MEKPGKNDLRRRSKEFALEVIRMFSASQECDELTSDS
jgi:hypothetical protein